MKDEFEYMTYPLIGESYWGKYVSPKKFDELYSKLEMFYLQEKYKDFDGPKPSHTEEDVRSWFKYHYYFIWTHNVYRPKIEAKKTIFMGWSINISDQFTFDTKDYSPSIIRVKWNTHVISTIREILGWEKDKFFFRFIFE